MRYLRIALGLALAMFLGQLMDLHAQRMSYSETEDVIDRIQERSEMFENLVKDRIDNDDMEITVERFEDATDMLDNRFTEDYEASPLVREVLKEAALIDSFITRHPVSLEVQTQWSLLRQDLDRLAVSYNFTDIWPTRLARVEPVRPPAPVYGQLNDQEMKDLIQDIQLSADAYQTTMTGALADPTYTGSGAAGVITQYVGDFRVSVGRLNTGYASGSLAVETVSDVLSKAEPIDRFMRTHPLSASSQESWLRLRNNLVRLAAAYNLSPVWLSR